jgi:sigma-54 interacting transcriptional regulator
MYMSVLSESERVRAEGVARVGYCNPFLPERVASERAALGAAFVERAAVWSVEADGSAVHPNVERLAQSAEELAAAMRARLVAGASATSAERQLYEDIVLYAIYSRYENAFYALTELGAAPGPVEFYAAFRGDLEHFLAVPGARRVPPAEQPHVFACLFQVRRAFHHIFRFIIGGSMPAARLRAAIWQSIFTHDMRRYRRALYERMDDITTLVTGPSGTGKELVARAIALSRYVAFEPKTQRFAEDFAGSFHPLNLSALSPTLIESELFGHQRGAFTGALQDRAGWLEVCGPSGTVFLDEIGDLDPAIQVKLLRVLQTRTFQRLGDTRARHFPGKIIAATNRDLGAEIRAGRFREDFYYRLCADLIATPTLRAQLDDAPADLRNLIRFLAERIAGAEEAGAIADEVVAWVEEHLGPAYAWPGNVRELEQCVRNVLIRREYRPPAPAAPSARDELAAAVCAGRLTAEELLVRYCTLVFAETGSYQETARRLGLDRRTVKARIDRRLLASFTGSASAPR